MMAVTDLHYILLSKMMLLVEFRIRAHGLTNYLVVGSQAL